VGEGRPPRSAAAPPPSSDASPGPGAPTVPAGTRRPAPARRAAAKAPPQRGALPGRRFSVPELTALAHGEGLVVLLQPIVSATGARIGSVEALVRWQHPRAGLLGPGEFLPEAERLGLMDTLTLSVLSTALEHRRAIAAAGHTLNLTVNVPPDLIMQERFTSDLLERLSEGDAEHLFLEVTEARLEDVVLAHGPGIDRLLGTGIRLALDDFAAGAASLIRLGQLPFSLVKLDRQLVQALLAAPSYMTIVRAIIELAHKLDMRVVAEGVEQPLLRARLQGLGCDSIQGFLFSPPVDREALLGLLTDGFRDIPQPLVSHWSGTVTEAPAHAPVPGRVLGDALGGAAGLALTGLAVAPELLPGGHAGLAGGLLGGALVGLSAVRLIRRARRA
jgi:EAL domain-containing protein (putative c-di-GMP-specific phosphodiesterase class I)